MCRARHPARERDPSAEGGSVGGRASGSTAGASGQRPVGRAAGRPRAPYRRGFAGSHLGRAESAVRPRGSGAWWGDPDTMRILAALSGGVDSAVAAARLSAEGAEVVGVHLQHRRRGRRRVRRGGAVLLRRRRRAGRTARRGPPGLPFYVVDVSGASGA